MRHFEWSTDEEFGDIVGVRSNGVIREIAFDDVHDLLRAKPVRHVSHNRGRHWLGVDDPSVIARRVTHGAPEVLRTVRGMLDEISADVNDVSVNQRPRRRRRKSDFGNEIDIHMVRQGHSERAWTKTVRVWEQGPQVKRIHLYVNLGASAMVSARDQLWRAAVAIKVYDALLRAGKSVAITVGFGARGMFADQGNGATFMSVPVKEYGLDVTADRLCAMFTAGFWRYHLVLEGANTVDKWRPLDSYGYPIDSYRVLPKDVLKDRQRGAQVVVIGQTFDRYTAHRVVERFKSQYADITSIPDGQTAAVLLR